MAIGMAQQKGNWVVAYDENNRELWTRSGELYGYTSSTVTIKREGWLVMYNEKNQETGCRSCNY